MGKETLSERQYIRGSLDWIRDMKQKDVDRIIKTSESRRGLSMRMIYEDCGIETAILLWRTLTGLTLYISEGPLNELRREYIRQNFDPDNAESCIKVLAAKLAVSEQFVYGALGDLATGTSSVFKRAKTGNNYSDEKRKA